MPDNVAIFWDYENCALPALEPSYMIVNKIRRLAHQYGSVKTFKAYVEYPEHQTVKSMALRSELQSCGVSLIDCPHNGRKDVADKMIMVDMMAYAIDNPAPATIILISGDRDFVYAVSILALRQYRVVLLAPRVAYSNLRAQANVVYNWPEDFFPELPPSKLSNPRGQRSSDSADDSHLQKSSNNGSYAPRYSKVAAKLPDRSYVPSDIRVDSTPLATNWALHDDREDQIPEWQGSPNPEEWLDEPDNTEEESETQPQDSVRVTVDNAPHTYVVSS
ncbi:NYN domain-containing protein [Dichomitus squalens]|uniref:NYN domain-containing protein n=1 Tax=Dichomitus squalens TaxID=114155 RepID=A0A4Q9QE76_9APHY|nr:NYN domain-containing protein [Dichomitus squalens]TBU50093.1 NYN domain-containing protein [Dichomitus squalens]TBU66117.1 NYN domain-containing protein [Dichomitus squalens]